jgi:hypothetical protein
MATTAIEIQTPVGTKLAIFKEDGKQVMYTLIEGKMPLAQYQFDLPEGSTIEWEDGAKLIHYKDYGLLRNYINVRGEKADRIAFRWNLAFVAAWR